MPELTPATTIRTRTFARYVARDGLLGGAVGLMFVIWLATTDNAIRTLTLLDGASTASVATLVVAIVAQFAVGAALGGAVLRMFHGAER